MRKRIEANTHNRSQLIATKCLFFEKKESERKNLIYLSFSRQTSSGKLQVSPHGLDCENEQIYTDGDGRGVVDDNSSSDVQY